MIAQHCQQFKMNNRIVHLKTGYIEFARLEYYADAIHSAIVNPFQLLIGKALVDSRSKNIKT